MRIAGIILLLACFTAEAAELGGLAEKFPRTQEQMMSLHNCLNGSIALKWTADTPDAGTLAQTALQDCDLQVGTLAERARKQKRDTREDLANIYRKAILQDITKQRADNPGYAQCVSTGGRWVVPMDAILRPLNTAVRCDALTADGGNSCSRKSDCAGACEVNFRPCSSQPTEKAGPEVFSSGQRCFTARCSKRLFDKPAVILKEDGSFGSPYAE